MKNKIGAIYQTFVQIGLAKAGTKPRYVRNKIVLSNQAALIYILALGAVFPFVLVQNDGFLTLLYGLYCLPSVLVLWFNYVGLFTTARLSFIFFSILFSQVLYAHLDKSLPFFLFDGSYHTLFITVTIVYQMYPFLLFDVREKKGFGVAASTALLWFIFYRHIDSFLLARITLPSRPIKYAPFEFLLHFISVFSMLGYYYYQSVKDLKMKAQAAKLFKAVKQKNTRLINQKRQLKKLSLLARFTENGVVICDSHLQIEWTNQAFEKMTGELTESYFINKSLIDCLFAYNEQSNEDKILFEEKLRLKREFEHKILLGSRDGTPFWALIHITPILGKNEVLQHYVLKIINIQKDVENEIILNKHQNRQENLIAELIFTNKQLEKVKTKLTAAVSQTEAAVRDRNRLLATVSHEIRNSLNNIGITLELLKETLLDPRSAEYVRRMELSNRMLNKLVSDLLDYERIAQGKIELSPHPIDLIDLIKRNVLLYQTEARKKNLYLVLETGPTDFPLVLVDDVRFSQVLHNLLSNAIKFTESGGVTVRVNDDTREDVRFLTLTVEDTGVGVPQHFLNDIFEPFYQIKDETLPDVTSAGNGVGLGLSISKHLIQRMNGAITAECRSEKGTLFRIELPLIPVEGYDLVPVQLSQLQATILLAEDDRINALFLRSRLAKEGYQVDYAPDGGVALSKISAKKYDVVLLDGNLPKMSGFEVARKIRASEKNGDRTPIFAVSGHSPAIETDVEINKDFDEYLSKPIDVPRLIYLIRKYLGQNNLISEKFGNGEN